MQIQAKLPHEKLAGYILGRSDRSAGSEIEKIVEEDPIYELLFNIIDQCLEKTAPADISPSQNTLNFSEIEDMLWRVVSDPHPEDAQLLLAQLSFSANFYQRLIEKLSVITPGLNTEDFPEMAAEYGIEVKTDDALLSSILGDGQPADPIVEHSIEIPQDILDDGETGHQTPANLLALFARYSMALAAVLVVGIGIYKLWPSEPGYIGIWENTPPFAFSSESSFMLMPAGDQLRSAEQTPQEIVKQLTGQMQVANVYYEDCDYKASVESLRIIQKNAQTLLIRVQNPLSTFPADQTEFVKQARLLLQDYYFFNGVSQLAYSTQDDNAIGNADRAEYQKRAVTLLDKAREIAVVFNIETDDRETYFSGLAHKFSGQHHKAIQAFRSVGMESSFKKQADKEIDEINSAS